MLRSWIGAAAVACAVAGPAPSQASEAYSFVVLGHTRGGPDNGIIPLERLEEMVAEVRRAEPDFVVLTGDLIYGDINKQWDPPGTPLDEAALRADWEAVDAVFDSIGVPIHRAPGNHDLWEHTTLALWKERYGEPYQSFRYGNALFLLLNSCWLPTEGDPARLPPKFIRGVQLPADQVDWVRAELDAGSDAEHVFAFMGHVLWWAEDAPWWSEVHPLLAEAPTRGVFCGDLGPWKWSHVERDGIHYVQSAVEFTDPPLVMLRNREGPRAISAQIDNYVLVSVDGDEVSYEVRTLGAMTTGRYTPAVYQTINEHDKGTLKRKLFNRFHTPEKMFNGFLTVGAAGLGGGLLIGLVLSFLGRRKRRAA